MTCAACDAPILAGEPTTSHTVTTSGGRVCQPIVTHARCWGYEPRPAPHPITFMQAGDNEERCSTCRTAIVPSPTGWQHAARA